MDKVVAYVRTSAGYDSGAAIQKELIQDYCRTNNIKCRKFYYDNGSRKKRHIDEREKANLLGLSPHSRVYSAWEDMMVDIIKGNVKVVLVDLKLRLYSGNEQQIILQRLVEKYNVEIIEVSHRNSPETDAMTAVIYHFADKADRRSIIPLKEIDTLYEFAAQRNWAVTDVYLDLTLCNRMYLRKILEDVSCDVLLVKSLYHIKRGMTAFIESATILQDKQIRIISMDEGEFIHDKTGMQMLNSPLRVAVYDRLRSDYEIGLKNIQLSRFNTFVRCKTKGWKVFHIYIDEGKGNQQLKSLINDVGNFDILLLDSYDKLGSTIIEIARMQGRIKKPIYSMQEGVILLNECRKNF